MASVQHYISVSTLERVGLERNRSNHVIQNLYITMWKRTKYLGRSATSTVPFAWARVCKGHPDFTPIFNVSGSFGLKYGRLLGDNRHSIIIMSGAWVEFSLSVPVKGNPGIDATSIWWFHWYGTASWAVNSAVFLFVGLCHKDCAGAFDAKLWRRLYGRSIYPPWYD